jgi:hypothetical protein
VLESLTLGLVGLGGSSAALTAGAVGLALGARLWLPTPSLPLKAELVRWWSRLGPIGAAGVAALVGGVLALVATLLHRPDPGVDGITYHLPEIVEFVQGGHPGSVLQVAYGLPVGNYPLTNEVLLAWITGLSHGFAALTLWSPGCGLLLVASGWLGLRELGVPTAVRALSLAALALSPLVFVAFAQPGTDLPSLSWLVCCAALCACARRRPGLLAVAIVALGLAVGTKTTALALGLLVVAAAAWSCRRRLASIALPLGLASATGAIVGGTWYLRNLIEHGSPLWPFLPGPWGDRMPAAIRLLSHTMLERLHVTLLAHVSEYVTLLQGSLVLLLGGLLVPLIGLRRRPLLAAGAVALGTVAWMNAPSTGKPDGPLLGEVMGNVRFLMPVFAGGALALALVATDARRRGRLVALATLTGALLWGIRADLETPFRLPFSSWLVVGVVAGGLLGGIAAGATPLARTRSGAARGPRASRIVAAVQGPAGATLFALLAAAALSYASAGFLARHAKVGSEVDAAVAGFLTAQPSFATGVQPVAMAPVALGPEAGDRLAHPLVLIGERESCRQVRARDGRGWVVVRLVVPQPIRGYPGLLYPPRGTAQACLAGERPRFDNGAYRIYGPSP